MINNRKPHGHKGFKPQMHKVLVFVLAALVMAGSLAFSGCGLFSDENKEKAKEKVAAVAEEAAEFAGEVTASWLGTTAANLGKGFEKSMIKRFEYLDITVDKIDSKTKDGEKAYTIELTLNNTAPESEKIFYNDLLGANYLVACDKNDYIYGLSPVEEGVEDGYDDDFYWDDSSNKIKPGKTHMKVYTTLPESEEIDHLLYIDKNLNLPE